MQRRSNESGGEQYYSPRRCAEITGMSEAYWRKQLRLKSIPHIKIGRRAVRIPSLALHEWLEAHAVEGQ